MDVSTISTIISILILISFASVIVLTISHLINGDTCPKVFTIPACYILDGLILLTLISHFNLLNDNNILFFFGAGISLLIAIFASISNIKGTLECPKLLGKIPMCYLSFFNFLLLIALKIIW